MVVVYQCGDTAHLPAVEEARTFGQEVLRAAFAAPTTTQKLATAPTVTSRAAHDRHTRRERIRLFMIRW